MSSVVGDWLNHLIAAIELAVSCTELYLFAAVPLKGLENTRRKARLCVYFFVFFRLAVADENGHDIFIFFEGVSINLANGLLDKITPRYHVISFVTC